MEKLFVYFCDNDVAAATRSFGEIQEIADDSATAFWHDGDTASNVCTITVGDPARRRALCAALGKISNVHSVSIVPVHENAPEQKAAPELLIVFTDAYRRHQGWQEELLAKIRGIPAVVDIREAFRKAGEVEWAARIADVSRIEEVESRIESLPGVYSTIRL